MVSKVAAGINKENVTCLLIIENIIKSIFLKLKEMEIEPRWDVISKASSRFDGIISKIEKEFLYGPFKINNRQDGIKYYM